MDWHDRYALNPRPFGDAPTPFLRDVFEAPASFGLPEGALRILCPGDGYGRNGLWLARRGHIVTGLDLVPAAVVDALSAAIESDASYLSIPADVSGSPFPLDRRSTFDAVVSAWMRLPGEAERRAWNKECTRSLVTGGTAVFIGGSRVTDARTEQAEWPDSLRWQDYSTADEVRLVGHKEAPAPGTRRPNYH